jgi:iron complex outermembrane receptor protein
VKAVYAEINVPVLDSLELSAAVRHDKYSDLAAPPTRNTRSVISRSKNWWCAARTAKVSARSSLYELYSRNTTYTQGY